MSLLDDLRDKYNIVETPTEELDAETGLTLSEKARLVAQGASLGWSDEIIGAIKGAVQGDVAGGIESERQSVKDAQEKKGSLKYEIGGAFVPGVLAAPYTGGGSMVPSLVRSGVIGATEGLVYGMGTAEGNVQERAVQGLDEAAIGLFLNPIAQKTIGYGTKIIPKLFGDFARRGMGKNSAKVEKEIIRLLDEANINANDTGEVNNLLQQIADGKIFAEISEDTAMVVRNLYAASGKGAQILAKSVESRADQFMGEAASGLQRGLAPALEENVERTFSTNLKKLKADEGVAYEKIFKSSKETGGVSAFDRLKSLNLNMAVEDLLNNQKFLRNNIATLISAKKLKPLFEVVKGSKSGKVNLLRDIDLETAEVIRRALKDKSDTAWKQGDGSLGGAVGDLETELRTIIDDISPDLKSTRSAWKDILTSQKIYKDAKTIFSKNADEMEEYIENILQDGTPAQIEALRAGGASHIRKIIQDRGLTRVISKFNQGELKEARILQYLYPSDGIDDILNKISKADTANVTKNLIIANNKIGTAKTLEGASRVGGMLGPLASFVTTGNPLSAISLISKLLGKSSGDLSEDQLLEIATILSSESPDLLRDALTDTKTQTVLKDAVFNIAQRIQGGIGTAVQKTTEITPIPDAIDKIVSPSFAGESDSLNQIISGASNTKKKKILAASNAR